MKISGTTMHKSIFAILILLSFPAFAGADINPIEKIKGQCPIRYLSSGNYCSPQANATKAIKKIGSCPTRFNSSGPFCVGKTIHDDVLVKRGSCPQRWLASGNYCVRPR